MANALLAIALILTPICIYVMKRNGNTNREIFRELDSTALVWLTVVIVEGLNAGGVSHHAINLGFVLLWGTISFGYVAALLVAKLRGRGGSWGGNPSLLKRIFYHLWIAIFAPFMLWSTMWSALINRLYGKEEIA